MFFECVIPLSFTYLLSLRSRLFVSVLCLKLIFIQKDFVDIYFCSIHCNHSQTYITRSATHCFSHNPWDNLNVFCRFALNQWQFAEGFQNQRKSEKKWELGSRRRKRIPEGLDTLGEELLSDRYVWSLIALLTEDQRSELSVDLWLGPVKKWIAYLQQWEYVSGVCEEIALRRWMFF